MITIRLDEQVEGEQNGKRPHLMSVSNIAMSLYGILCQFSIWKIFKG